MRATILMLLLAGATTALQAEEPVRLEEIMVTATLRDIPLQQLSASVTVLYRGDIEDSATQHLEELLLQVPSLSWAGASSRPRYFQLRGIGELEQYQGAPNPSVGFLVDEIDFSGIGMVATLFDVEQVEVLRGPQGTRFGANGLAGLIKLKTRDPQPQSSLSLETTLGDDATAGAGAVAGGALGSDGSAWRLALQRTTSDGFRRNVFLGRRDTNARDELTARGRARLEISEELRLDLSLLRVELDNGYDAFAIDNSFMTRSDRPGRDAQRSTGFSADAVYDAGTVALRSITTWAQSSIESSFDGDWGNDVDWGAAGPYDFFSRTLRDRRSASQDLRLSGGEARAGWVFGAYLLRLEEDNAQRDDGLYLADAFVRELDSRYRATSTALYGEADWSLAGERVISAGLRVEQRVARYADSDGLAFAPRDRMWGGQLSLNQRLGESTHAWLSMSRGFKAGGFNIGVAIPADRAQYAPEYLWSLEAGLKSRWDDRGLAAEVSGYFMRRVQQQVASSWQLDPEDPLTFVYLTDNAARGRALGLEATARWQLSPRWMLSGSLSLEHSEYIGYRYGDRDLDGRAWAHAPAWKYSLAATWRHPRGWMARVDVGGQDAFFFDTSHDQRARPYSLLNLRAGYEAARWSLQLWVDNLLDRRYPVRGFYFGDEPPDFPEKLYLRLGDPRHAGVTATFRF